MGIKMKMARLGLKLKKNAPTICVVGGVTLMAVGTVFACKASRYSLDEALNSEKDHIKHIHEVYETYGNTEKSPYDKKDYVHDLVQCYTKTSLRVAKNYIVPALMFTAGAGLVFKGHSMMAARNAAIAAAYQTANSLVERYRKGVTERYGADAAYQIENGVSPDYVEKEIEEKGKIKSVVETNMAADADRDGTWSFWMDPETLGFEYMDNVTYMTQKAEYAVAGAFRKVTVTKGFCFMNEFLEMCGVRPEKMMPEGQILGWYYDLDKKTGCYPDITYKAQNKRFSDGTVDYTSDKYVLVTMSNMRNIMDDVFSKSKDL